MPHSATLVLVFSASIVCVTCVSTPALGSTETAFHVAGDVLHEPVAKIILAVTELAAETLMADVEKASGLRSVRQAIAKLRVAAGDKASHLRGHRKVPPQKAMTDDDDSPATSLKKKKKPHKKIREINELQAKTASLKNFMTPKQLADHGELYQVMMRSLGALNFRANNPESHKAQQLKEPQDFLVDFLALKACMWSALEGQDKVKTDIDSMTDWQRKRLQDLLLDLGGLKACSAPDSQDKVKTDIDPMTDWNAKTRGIVHGPEDQDKVKTDIDSMTSSLIKGFQ